MNEILKNKWFLWMILILAVAMILVISIWNGMDPDKEADVVQQQAASEVIPSENETDVVPGASEGYFLVKESDGAVNVYWYQDGKKELYRETSIQFSMLGTEDQQLMKTGIQLEDEQELANFLENFDS